MGRAGQCAPMGRQSPRPDAGPRGPGRQGVLCLVRCADRIHRRHLGMGRRQGPGRGPRSAGRRRVGTLVAGAGGAGRHLCPVHGQGQCAVPHGGFPLHPDRRQRDHGGGQRLAVGEQRALEAGGPAEGLQLAGLLRRQVLDLAEARGVHGPRPGAAAGGLLALVGDGQHAGGLRRHLYLGAVPDPGERRPGRRAGQFRQPHPEIHRDPVRGRRARGRGAWRAGAQAGGRRGRQAGGPGRADGGHGVQEVRPGAASALGAGQPVPHRGGALDGDQDRSRPGGGGGALWPEPGGSVRQGLGTLHPIRGGEDR